MSHLNLKITGVRGGSPSYIPNKGRVVAFIDSPSYGDENYIAIDAFEGQMDTYKRRVHSDIEVKFGNVCWNGTMIELAIKLFTPEQLGFNPKFWEAMQKEAIANREWAIAKKEELGSRIWKGASKVSQDMLIERLDKSIDLQTFELYRYRKMRAHAKQGMSFIDKPAKELWEKITGEKISDE